MLHICRTLSCFRTNLSYFEPDLSYFHRVYPTLSPICPTLLWSFVLPYFRWKRQPDPCPCHSTRKYLQGWPLFLPPPYFPMCQNGEKIESWTGHPLKWQSPELATLKKLQSPVLSTPKFTKVLDSANFWGWQVLDSVISEGGQFGTRLFLSLEHLLTQDKTD